MYYLVEKKKQLKINSFILAHIAEVLLANDIEIVKLYP